MKPKINKIGRRGKTVLAVLIAVMFVSVVSAAVIPHFGKITTTANVEAQAVQISADGITWLSYNDAIEHTIPHTSPGGETFCYKQWVWNSASILVDVTFDRIDSWDAEVTTKIFALSPTTTLILENKDANWNIISGDDIQATITFDTVATTFNYDLTATGLSPTTEYALIYYADKDLRFDPTQWGGDNPGAIINIFTTDASGDNTQINSVELGMNLPAIPDWNIDPGDEYRYDPDNYVHWQGGAKIWIVPTSDLTDGNKLPVQNWNPTAFLFETDLIIYLDCDLDVNDYFCGLVGDPDTSITVQSGQKIPTLICYIFDLHIGKGTYKLITTVDATETP